MYFLSEDKIGGRKGDLNAEMITGPCKDEGKNWGDASLSQVMPKISSRSSEARQDTEQILTVFQKEPTLPTLDFHLMALRTAR